jgi:hypothetical protein
MLEVNNMYRDFVIFRNELKNSKLPKYKLIGIITEILFSKEIFYKNIDISNFLENVFYIEFKPYVMKSRTMIVARISRIIYNSERNEYIEYKKNLLRFLNCEIEKMHNDGKQKKEKNQFDGWLNSDE